MFAEFKKNSVLMFERVAPLANRRMIVDQCPYFFGQYWLAIRIQLIVSILFEIFIN